MIEIIDDVEYISTDFCILNGALERLSFTTSISNSIDNTQEFRNSLRFYPYTEFNFPLKFYDQTDLTQLFKIISDANIELLVDDFDIFYDVAISELSKFIPFNTDNSSIRNGSIIKVFTSSGIVYRRVTALQRVTESIDPENLENIIKSVDKGFVLNDFIDDAYQIRLMHTCVLTTDISYSLSYSLIDSNIQLISSTDVYYPQIDNLPTFKSKPYIQFMGYDILYKDSNISIDIDSGSIYDFDKISLQSKVTNFEKPIISKSLNILLNSKSDTLYFKSLLNTLKGQLTEFFMPSFEKAYSEYSISGSYITIPLKDFDESIKYLAINTISDNYEPFEIISKTINGSSIVLNLGSNIGSAKTICPINLVRLGSDSFEFKYHSNSIIELSSSLVELGYE